jgi:hypothetical protein
MHGLQSGNRALDLLPLRLERFSCFGFAQSQLDLQVVKQLLNLLSFASLIPFALTTSDLNFSKGFVQFLLVHFKLGQCLLFGLLQLQPQRLRRWLPNAPASCR